MRILLLAPQPFFQARGTPIAVRLVLEFLTARGHQVDVLTYHEGSDVEIPNCRIARIPRHPWGTEYPAGVLPQEGAVRCGDARELRSDDAPDPVRPGACGGGVRLHRRRAPALHRRSLRLRHGLLAGRAVDRCLPGLGAGGADPAPVRGGGGAAERRRPDRVRRAAGHRAGPRAEHAGRTGGGHDAPRPRQRCRRAEAPAS